MFAFQQQIATRIISTDPIYLFITYQDAIVQLKQSMVLISNRLLNDLRAKKKAEMTCFQV